jgi:hypothetical protein
MKERKLQINSYAGLLLAGSISQPGQISRRKSAVLLLARLLVSLLFIYVGISQASCLPRVVSFM